MGGCFIASHTVMGQILMESELSTYLLLAPSESHVCKYQDLCEPEQASRQNRTVADTAMLAILLVVCCWYLMSCVVG